MLRPRLSLALIAVFPLGAQLLVDTYAGGAIQSGVPAGTALFGYPGGIAFAASGAIVFSDPTYNVIRSVGTSGLITTIAGTGVAGFAGDGGLATSSLLNSPTVLHSDPSGNIYFFDSGNRRIRRIDPHGIITTVAGDGQVPVADLDTAGPATSRSIGNVYSFAVDSDGNLYFALGGDTRIYRVSADGTLGIFAQVPPVPGSMNVGLLAVDSIGGVYCFDSWTYNSPNSLLRFSPSGTISTFATFPAASPSVSSTGYLLSDQAGRIYTAVNGQFRRYSLDGTAIPVNDPYPYPSTIDANGNMVVSLINSSIQSHQFLFPAIALYNQQTGLTYIAGNNSQPAPDGTPLRNAWFFGPISFSFSPSGDLYIVEQGDCVIRKIGSDGVLTTFAGVGKCGNGAPTGNAKTARLGNPVSAAIDSQNRVWVSDSSSQLYSIAQDGTISSAIATQPGSLPGGAPQLAVDSKDRVYILNSTSLSRRLSDGSLQTISVPLSFGSPAYLFGLGRDSSGNVQFSAGDGLYVVNDDASVTLTNGNFFPSVSLAFDPAGTPWGTYNRLATSNSSGLVEIGGLAGFGFAGDGGPLQSAGMHANGSVAFGPDGNLYFADNGLRIRRVTGSAPSAPPVISQNGIVNGATYTGGPIAPGELITIFGSNFGASGLAVNSPVNNAIPFALGRTKVLFNGIDSVISALTPNQVNVFVPYVLGPGTIGIQVQVDDVLSAPVTIPVAPTAPGFSSSILNQDGTVNTAANPAPRGSIVSFFGTGLGQTTPQLPDGALAIATPYSTPLNAPTLTIGGQPATILYSGDAPGFPTGVFQINATIPTAVSPGPASVSNQVTVFVK